ncbi:MAG: sulfite exporter TauE/SafE family protein [SAR324 cluster bacterium]|nr:sulfite exporter TauE/SafE family protein [SAR324 cluster bacterium]
MGTTLGMLGGGGSILTVPILVYLFEISPVLATAYSLFVVGLASLVGSVSYMRQELVNFKAGLVFALPAFLGVFAARRFLIPNLPEVIFDLESFTLSKDLLIMLVFSVVMILASVSMIRKGKPKHEENTELQFNYSMIALEGLIVGGVTGFIGAGGGFLIVPALVLLAGLPIKQAIGTSLMIIAAKSLLGFLGDLNPSQQIDWSFLFLFSSLSIFGILIGTYLNRFVEASKLKPAFGWFVLLMGSAILLKETAGSF